MDRCHSPERAPGTCSSAAAHRGTPKWGNQNLAWQQEITAGNKKEKNEAKWISGEQMAEGVKTKKQQEESLPPKKTKQQIVGSKCYTDNKNEASRGNLGNYRSVNCTSVCTKLIGMIIKNRTSHNTAQCACLRGKPCLTNLSDFLERISPAADAEQRSSYLFRAPPTKDCPDCC